MHIVVVSFASHMTSPKHKRQEIPFDHSNSNNMFQPSPDKPLLATAAAIEEFQHETIIGCLQVLRRMADEQNGIDYLQVFEFDDHPDLWFLEDGEGGAITAMLPSDY